MTNSRNIPNRVQDCPTMPWSELRDWTFNALKAERRSVDELVSAIIDEGFCDPLMVWEPGRYVFDGTGRRKALDILADEGYELPDIPFVRVRADDLDGAKRLALMKSSQHGKITQQSFDLFVGSFESIDLAHVAQQVRFDGIKIQTRAQMDLDEPISDPPKKPKTRAGDLIELGDHRLLCGDCTDRENWDRVLQGRRPDAVITDPPYGVDLDYDAHDDSEESLRELIAGWLPIARELAPVVAFTGGVERAFLYPRPSWVLCWWYAGGQKSGPWGFNCWQPIMVYGDDPSLSSGNGRRPDGVSLNTPANLGELDHPCPKPMPLWKWLFERILFGSSLVVDPFAGSGSGIIVAEEQEHQCASIELSPAYCDVIVERWENLTGRKAKRPQRRRRAKS